MAEQAAGKGLKPLPQGLPPETGGRKRRESPMVAKHLMSELKLRPPEL